MSKATVLMIEDNKSVLELNAAAFIQAGYAVRAAETLAEARRRLSEAPPDLIVLDIMMPDGSGLDFCREIRAKHAAPVIFLTVLGEQSHIIQGLKNGGDEYMVKPFQIGELLARAEALLRRVEMDRRRFPSGISVGPVTLNIITQRAYLYGEDLLLKPREFALLLFFVQNMNIEYSPEEVYRAVWEQEANNSVQTVRVHIAQLRKKVRMDDETSVAIHLIDRKRYVCRSFAAQI